MSRVFRPSQKASRRYRRPEELTPVGGVELPL
jgi:hypothetical protein